MIPFTLSSFWHNEQAGPGTGSVQTGMLDLRQQFSREEGQIKLVFVFVVVDLGVIAVVVVMVEEVAAADVEGIVAKVVAAEVLQPQYYKQQQQDEEEERAMGKKQQQRMFIFFFRPKRPYLVLWSKIF